MTEILFHRKADRGAFFAAFAALIAAIPLATFAATSGDAAKGKTTYAQRCGTCHSIEFNGAGPAHHGVYGRKAGTVANFAYSPALKASGVTWTNETLEKWLSDPEKFIPGQKMWISVPDAVERQDIIAYLRAETNQK